MITRLVLLLAVLCCFSSYSNAQTIIGDDPTVLNLSDDSWSNVDLGFDVTYFGQTFDNITIYTNGMALFGDNRGYAGNCCNGYKPTQDQHDYGIFPFWTDLITINNNTTTGLQGVYYLSDNTDTFQMAWIDISEFYNDQTSNTFGVEIKSTSTGASIDFFYEELDIRNHSIWSGLTGDVSEGEVIENFFHNQQNGLFTGDSSLDWSYNVTSIDCSNPLNDPSCDGYEQAYFEQQCTANALYDPQCSGYEQAYFDQQCSADALYDPACPGYETAYTEQQCQQDSLYDPSCPGYEQAYEDQQCSLDPLWSPKCSGYQMAYEEQQCLLNPQYKPTCLGYQFEDTTIIDTTEYDAFGNVKTEETEIYFEETDEYFFSEEVYEEAVEEIIILEEVIEDFDVLEDDIDIIEENEEIVEEDVATITETTPSPEEVSGENETKTTRTNTGSRIGLSVGLGTADRLVSGLISNSIQTSNTSSQTESEYFDNGTSSISNITSGGASMQEMMNTNTTEQTNEQNIETSIAIPSLMIGVSINNQKVEIEVKKETSLAERIAEKVRQSNLEKSATYKGQTAMIQDINNAVDLTAYDQVLTDRDEIYVMSQIYPNNVMKTNNGNHYRMRRQSYGVMREMIRSQY